MHCKIEVQNSLQKNVQKASVPSIAGIFILGWVSGWVTNQYTNMFADTTPGFIKYITYCFCGIGVTWFAHELFLACIVLLLIRLFDKKDKLYNLCKKANIWVLIFLVAEAILLPILYEILSRIPVIRFLLLGISKKTVIFLKIIINIMPNYFLRINSQIILKK